MVNLSQGLDAVTWDIKIVHRLQQGQFMSVATSIYTVSFSLNDPIRKAFKTFKIN